MVGKVVLGSSESLVLDVCAFLADWEREAEGLDAPSLLASSVVDCWLLVVFLRKAEVRCRAMSSGSLRSLELVVSVGSEVRPAGGRGEEGPGATESAGKARGLVGSLGRE